MSNHTVIEVSQLAFEDIRERLERAGKQAPPGPPFAGQPIDLTGITIKPVEHEPFDPDKHEPIHSHFGLTYASYWVMQRSVLQAMPQEWQHRFVMLMNELNERIDIDQIPQQFWVRATDGKHFITDPYSNYRHGPRPPLKADQDEREAAQ